MSMPEALHGAAETPQREAARLLDDEEVEQLEAEGEELRKKEREKAAKAAD